MKRKIIQINESKCNGCGLCIPNCPEGALQVIDGKARLISDLFCDGLGACVGNCPTGAMKVVEREAEPYDERQVMLQKIIPAGENTIIAHLKHLQEHNAEDLLKTATDVLQEQDMANLIDKALQEKEESSHHHGCSCPGSMSKIFEKNNDDSNSCDCAASPAVSQLQHWPVQLMLVSPNAPFFKNASLLVSADCVPFAYAGFHNELLKDKVVVTFCPKLDQTLDIYVEKLKEILQNNNIKSITIARMEVPCCSGTEQIVKKAIAASGKAYEIDLKIIALDGSGFVN